MTDQDQSQPEFDQESLNAVEGLVQRLSTQLDELKTKQKELQGMLKNVFDNDESLSQAKTMAEEANQTFKSRTGELNDTQEVKDLKLKLADMREDIKLVEESLNTHLLNYYQMTNSMTFPTPDGAEREFVLKAKLKPKKIG